MKITKFVHSCLLVEMPEPVNRTALFDPGIFSEDALNIDALEYLDDIVITHVHPDHCSPVLLPKLVQKFPEARITAPEEVLARLRDWGIHGGSTTPPEGIELFNSPHESLSPNNQTPEEIGVHYLGLLSHPGDSHSFTETKQILALPITAPWGSFWSAVNLAGQLKPKYVLPIHDWHWNDDARIQSYENARQVLEPQGITFVPLVTGEPIVIDIA